MKAFVVAVLTVNAIICFIVAGAIDDNDKSGSAFFIGILQIAAILAVTT